jgi:hypothetical protein
MLAPVQFLPGFRGVGSQLVVDGGKLADGVILN